MTKELESKRRGPATYTIEHKLTERRPDFGIVKIKMPIHIIKEEDLEDDRPDLYPNYNLDKEKKSVFKYHEPLKDLSPKHTPEKEHFPEKWKFYDFNLDTVREEIAKEIAFARN
jgi:hypothetical protein